MLRLKMSWKVANFGSASPAGDLAPNLGGRSVQNSAALVCQETQLLLRCTPGLLRESTIRCVGQLNFQSGHGYAGLEMQQWLREQATGVGVVAQQSAPAQALGSQQGRIRTSYFPGLLSCTSTTDWLDPQAGCRLLFVQHLADDQLVPCSCPAPFCVWAGLQQTRPAEHWNYPLHARTEWLPKSQAVHDRAGPMLTHHQ